MRALAGGRRGRSALIGRGAGRRRALQELPPARRGGGARTRWRTAAAAGGRVGRRGRRRRRHLRRRTLTSGLQMEGGFILFINGTNSHTYKT